MNPARLTPLGQLASLQAGVGFPLHLQGRIHGDFPLAKVGDISRVGRSGESVLSTADHYVDHADLPLLKAIPIPAGSILFSKIGEAIRQNHRVIAGRPLLIDNNAMAAIPNERIDSRYLYQFLRTIDFYALASATTVPALRKSDLERILVPLLPLPEQRRIAEILDKADALRAKRRAAIAQLDTFSQSIFLDMFGDPATNPKGWEQKKLGGLLSEVYRYPTYYDIDYVDDGVPEIRGELLKADGTIVSERSRLRYISESTSSRFPRTVLEAGDLVMTVRGTVGKIGLVPEELSGANMTANLLRLAPDRRVLDPKFILHFMQTSYFRSKIDGVSSSTTIQTIKVPDLKEIPVYLPPLAAQRVFAESATKVASHLALHWSACVALNSLFASLQKYAFSGNA